MTNNKSLPERFAFRFEGLERAHGTTNAEKLKLNKRKGKMEGSSFVIKEPPSIELWSRHLNGDYGLGIFPLTDDATCRWGAIDIDVYDLDHKALERQVEDIGLPLIVCRTKSGGAHLYLFCTEFVSAKLIRSKLMDWAVVLGHSGVEVFPKQVALANDQDFGNWLNMPYYNSAKSTRYAYKGFRALQEPSEFMDYADERAVAPEQLETLEVEYDEAFLDGPPCLQALSKKGFPEGARNESLFSCAVYLRKRYQEEWEPELDKINSRFMLPPLGHKEVAKVAKSANTKTYNYRCNEDPIRGVCNRQICLTRKFGVRGGAEELNVNINGIVKIGTDPVTWIVDVNGERIEVDTEVLLTQRRFRMRVAERLNMLPNIVKATAWDKLIDEKIRTAEVMLAPLDASPSGQLLTHLEDFCTDSQAMEKEELLNGLPWTDTDRVKGPMTYFRSSDFKMYLEQKRVRGWPEQKLWAALRHIGSEHRQFNMKGKCIQTWGVPAFAQMTEEFDVPRASESDSEF
jgi:hypothetical protein